VAGAADDVMKRRHLPKRCMILFIQLQPSLHGVHYRPPTNIAQRQATHSRRKHVRSLGSRFVPGTMKPFYTAADQCVKLHSILLTVLAGKEQRHLACNKGRLLGGPNWTWITLQTEGRLNINRPYSQN